SAPEAPPGSRAVTRSPATGSASTAVRRAARTRGESPLCVFPSLREVHGERREFPATLAGRSSRIGSPRTAADGLIGPAPGRQPPDSNPAWRGSEPAARKGPRMRTETTAATTASTRPFTGKEFLESLRGPREVWIYG